MLVLGRSGFIQVVEQRGKGKASTAEKLEAANLQTREVSVLFKQTYPSGWATAHATWLMQRDAKDLDCMRSLRH